MAEADEARKNTLINAIHFYAEQLDARVRPKNVLQGYPEKGLRAMLDGLKTKWETEKARIAAPTPTPEGQVQWTNPITGAVTYTAPGAPDPYGGQYYGIPTPPPYTPYGGQPYGGGVQDILDELATSTAAPRIVTIGGYEYEVQVDPLSGEDVYTMIGPVGGAGARQQPQPEGPTPTDPYGRTAVWDANDGVWRYPPNWAEDPTTLEAGYIPPYQQQQQAFQQQQLASQQGMQTQMIEWYQQQQGAQLQAQKEAQLANLRANPASWLEYASLAGETPAIQPWMLPLMPQQYQGLQAGAAIPGWQGQGAQGQGIQGPSLSGLPQLTTPSTQYLARIGPTAQQQFAGYRQARTGATPEETQWRLWSQAPPGGTFSGLRRTR